MKHEREKREREKERRGEEKGGKSKKDAYILLSDSFSGSAEHTFQNQAGNQRLIK